jgi:prophage maintenance system killer protein
MTPPLTSMTLRRRTRTTSRRNQPFLDGNKRAGLGAAAAFLFVNGIDFGDRDEDGESVLAKAMLDVAERRWSEPRRALAEVLRRLSGAR